MYEAAFSLAELNRAIAELVADLNARPMRRLGISRRDLFLELDRPVLKPLPAAPYEHAEWRLRRVGLDYHVDIDGHYYSVPHRLIREQLDARIIERTIELFCRGERVAVHLRGGGRSHHTTIPEHMPSAHRRYADRTIERIRADAAAIGPSTAKLVALILESRPYPEQGYRACLGILRLARHAGSAASASRMGRFETKWPSRPENLTALANMPGQWIDTGAERYLPLPTLFKGAMLASNLPGIWRMPAYEVPDNMTSSDLISPRYILAGHSHAVALGLPRSSDSTPALKPISGFDGMLMGLTGALPRTHAYWNTLINVSPNCTVFLIWAGNRYLVSFLIEAGFPFDFYLASRPDIPVLTEATLVPEMLVRDYLNFPYALLKRVLQRLKRVPGCKPVVLGTPPPKGNDTRLRALLLKTPKNSVLFHRAVGDIKLTHPMVRQKLWLVTQELLCSAAEEISCEFVPVPPEAMDDAGFLREEFWNEDLTHANHLYGDLFWRGLIGERGTS